MLYEVQENWHKIAKLDLTRASGTSALSFNRFSYELVEQTLIGKYFKSSKVGNIYGWTDLIVNLLLLFFLR